MIYDKFHAQFKEDEKIYALLGNNCENLFYVDVGAYDPTFDSVTKFFYENGSRGINIEPVRHLHEKLVEGRPRDMNILGALGLCNEKRLFRTVLQGKEITGLSTLHEQNMQNAIKNRDYQEEYINIWTLEYICKNFVPLDIEIDFLKIDVEGWEEQVILGGNWKRYRPKVLCIEATIPNTKIRCDFAWNQFLYNQCEYSFVEHDGLNNYYIRVEGI